jgi:predicted phosphodiesterase
MSPSQPRRKEATPLLILMHSSDIHIDDGPGPSAYTGLLGLRCLLQEAAAVAADVVLLAGDTFDNGRVGETALAEAASLLAAAQMPVVMLPGNHDPALPDNIFRRAGMMALPQLYILGLTHGEAIVFEALSLEIRGRAHRGFGEMPPVPEPCARRTRWQVVMAHGHYVPPSDWEEQAHRAWRISDAALAATGADYIALGHWDRPAQVSDRFVRAYYSGAPDLAGTANLVQFAASGDVTVERHPLRLP